MGLLGILLGLALLVWLAFRGWSILLLAPIAALIAAAFAGEPLLAHWTQTFMGGAAGFVSAIARWMTGRLGPQRAMMAVVLAGAAVTYGGVSLFVAIFVLAPMAQALFPCRIMARW